MTESEFWNLIEQSRESTSVVADSPKWLVDHLARSPVNEILDFAREFRKACDVSHDFRLCAAATAICGYCSDDTFADFCAWLIGQGRSVFERALENPDSLADLSDFCGDDGDASLGSLASVAFRAYETKTGRKDFWEQLPDFPPYVLKNEEAWDGKPETLEKIVPRLYAKFGSRQ